MIIGAANTHINAALALFPPLPPLSIPIALIGGFLPTTTAAKS
jgi:hypothetical protein